MVGVATITATGKLIHHKIPPTRRVMAAEGKVAAGSGWCSGDAIGQSGDQGGEYCLGDAL